MADRNPRRRSMKILSSSRPPMKARVWQPVATRCSTARLEDRVLLVSIQDNIVSNCGSPMQICGKSCFSSSRSILAVTNAALTMTPSATRLRIASSRAASGFFPQESRFSKDNR